MFLLLKSLIIGGVSCVLLSSSFFLSCSLQSGNAQSTRHLGAVGSSDLLSDEVVSEQLTRFALVAFFP